MTRDRRNRRPVTRTLFLYNPAAGQGQRPPLPFPAPPGSPAAFFPSPTAWRDDVLEYLRERGVAHVDAVAAPSAEDAARLARDAATAGTIDLVLAAGGDGTLRAVASGLAGTGVPLGIVPRGTVNVLARTLGIPLGASLAACHIALSGRTQALDLGRIITPDQDGDDAQNASFLLMASAGVDAQSVASVNADLKGVVGAPAYVLSGLATLANFVPPHVTLTLDNGRPRTMPAFMVVVANVPSYGGDFRIAPEASPTDGLLDVCVFEVPAGIPPPLQGAVFLRQIGAVALGRGHNDPDVAYFRARRVEIVADPPVAVQADGDPLARPTPLVAEVAPGALLVRVP